MQQRLKEPRWGIHSSGLGKDEDEAAAYKAALGQLGYRIHNSTESQDGTVERLMYARFEDNNHEQRTTLKA